MKSSTNRVWIRIGMVLSVVLAGFASGCTSIQANPDYAGERFPMEYEVVSGYVSINMSDVGGVVSITAEEEAAVWQSIRENLRDNAYGYAFSFPDSLRGADADKRKALEALFLDAVRNIKTGIPSEPVISSPFLKQEFSSSSEYLLFFKYTGYFLSDTILGLRMAADFLAATIGKNQSSDTDDSSELTILFFDNRNKKYVLCDTSTIDGYKENPRAPEIVKAHLEWFFENIEELREKKEK
jgi:hypothetical protein